MLHKKVQKSVDPYLTSWFIVVLPTGGERNKTMMTVKEVSQITGLSVRTLHHYDKIGLLKPASHSDAGYRLYDDAALEKLMQIMLVRTLEFPLDESKSILNSKNFDRNKALKQHIEMLSMKKEHLENLITLAQGILMRGENHMSTDIIKADFEQFDESKLDEYMKRAKESYGETDAWKEFEQKNKHRSLKDNQKLGDDMMQFFHRLGEMRSLDPASEKVQQIIEELRSFITEHYYNCTPQIFSGLGRLYACGGEFTDNIDAAGGEGTGEFAFQAIQVYCKAHNA